VADLTYPGYIMKTVLITEDDLNTREMFSMIVESLGHISVLSSTGKRALHILEDNPNISLLITNVFMPEMDGITLVKILRSGEQFAFLPIIIISGVAKRSDVTDLLESGRTYFFPKPTNIDQLKDCINRSVE